LFNKNSKDDIEKLEKQWLKDKNNQVFVKIPEYYIQENKLQSAISVLQDGIEYFPNHIMARIMLSRVYIKINEKVNAMETLEYILKIDPRNTTAIALLAPLYKEYKRYTDALPLYEMLELIDSSDAVVADLNFIREKVKEIQQREESAKKEEKEEVKEEKREEIVPPAESDDDMSEDSFEIVKNIGTDMSGLIEEGDEKNKAKDEEEEKKEGKAETAETDPLAGVVEEVDYKENDEMDPKIEFKIQVLKEQAKQYVEEKKLQVAMEIFKDVLKMKPDDEEVKQLMEELEHAVEEDADEEEVPTLENELQDAPKEESVKIPVDEDLYKYTNVSKDDTKEEKSAEDEAKELSEVFGSIDEDDDYESEEKLSEEDMEYWKKGKDEQRKHKE